MSHTVSGMLIGAILAAISLQWGFGGFILGLVFVAIGGVIGRWASGKLDLRGVGQALVGRKPTKSD